MAQQWPEVELHGESKKRESRVGQIASREIGGFVRDTRKRNRFELTLWWFGTVFVVTLLLTVVFISTP